MASIDCPLPASAPLKVKQVGHVLNEPRAMATVGGNALLLRRCWGERPPQLGGASRLRVRDG